MYNDNWFWYLALYWSYSLIDILSGMFSGILSEIFLACVRPLHPEIAKEFGAREKAGSRRGPLPPELALWIMCRAQAISITSGGCKELLALAAWRLRAQCCPKQRRAGRGQTRRRRRRSTRRRRRNRTFKDPHRDLTWQVAEKYVELAHCLNNQKLIWPFALDMMPCRRRWSV